jgi:hypothetical protein
MKYLAFLLVGGVGFAADADEIRSAATKSIELLQKVGADWKPGCPACHHQTIPLSAYGVFRKHGLPIDEKAVQAQMNPLGFMGDLEAVVQWLMVIDPSNLDSLVSNALAAQGVKPNLATDIAAYRVARLQRPDGHWANFDGRPPMSGSIFTGTATAAKAVRDYYPAAREHEKKAVLAKAAKFLASAKTQSTEDASFQLLGLVWTGAAVADRTRSASALFGLQNQDGGWAQLPGLESDAYATGEALWALAENDSAVTTQPTWKKGLAYLRQTQLPDGSWHVKTRYQAQLAKISPPYFESGFPHGADQFISNAATTYAALALAKALAPAASPAVPGEYPAVTVRDEPAWMRTAYFGTPADLEKALKAGLDPNSATAGGTTLLMVAAHDPAKVEVLLKAGANATATAKTGFDALMVASMYPGNLRSLELLMAKGASPKPRKGIRFGLTPVMYAVYSGDVAMIEALARAGGDVNQVNNLVGQVPSAPLDAAVAFEELEAIRVLVKNGAKIDREDDQGITVAGIAAIEHKARVIPALRELGVDFSHKSKRGFTPVELSETFLYPPAGLKEALRP